MIAFEQKLKQLNHLIDRYQSGDFSCQFKQALDDGLIEWRESSVKEVCNGMTVTVYERRPVINRERLKAYAEQFGDSDRSMEAKLKRAQGYTQKALECLTRANEQPFESFKEGYFYGPYAQEYALTTDGWRDFNYDWASFYQRKAQNELTP